jgi:hypothetical protein
VKFARKFTVKKDRGGGRERERERRGSISLPVGVDRGEKAL